MSVSYGESELIESKLPCRAMHSKSESHVVRGKKRVLQEEIRRCHNLFNFLCSTDQCVGEQEVHDEDNAPKAFSNN